MLHDLNKVWPYLALVNGWNIICIKLNSGCCCICRPLVAHYQLKRKELLYVCRRCERFLLFASLHQQQAATHPPTPSKDENICPAELLHWKYVAPRWRRPVTHMRRVVQIETSQQCQLQSIWIYLSWWIDWNFGDMGWFCINTTIWFGHSGVNSFTSALT